jgi:hypothetical protein
MDRLPAILSPSPRSAILTEANPPRLTSFATPVEKNYANSYDDYSMWGQAVGAM